MALEIVWTKRAIIGYDKVVAHLEKHWTEKEVKNFVRQSIDFFELLKDYPEMLEMTGKQKMFIEGQSISTPF